MTGRQPPRTHDLPRPLDDQVETDARWEEIRTACEALSDYAVSPRYPEWELTALGADPAEAVRNAVFVLEFALTATEMA